MRGHSLKMLSGIALGTSLAFAACSSSKESEAPRVVDDVLVIEAGDETRAQLGVSIWGVRFDPDRVTVIRGYNGAQEPVVEVKQANRHTDESQSTVMMAISGLGARAEMAARVQSRENDSASTRVNVEMLENTFVADARARQIAELLGKDAKAHPPRPTESRPGGGLLQFSPFVDGSLLAPVPSDGGSSLTPGGATCTKLSIPCITSLVSLVAEAISGIVECGTLVKQVLIQLTCRTVDLRADAGTGDGGTSCTPASGQTISAQAQACAAAAEKVGNRANASQSACKGECGGGSSSGPTPPGPGPGPEGDGGGDIDAGPPVDGGTSSTWTCQGQTGTTRPHDGKYYLTSFGCWVDESGTIQTDSSDNCEPSCLDELKAKRLCTPGATGPECEEQITWFTADTGRYACGTKLRITNPVNGKKVVAVAIDLGPACTVERQVSHEALDVSGRVSRYLFGGDKEIMDRAIVDVEPVEAGAVIGPIE